MIRIGLLRGRWYLPRRGISYVAAVATALVLGMAVATPAHSSAAAISCTEGRRQPVTANTPLTAYEAPTPPGATVEELPDGGKVYIEHHGELTIKTPIPPKGFDPKTATDAELSRYYFPPKPTDPVELEAWNRTFGNLKAPAPPGRCERPVHNQPRESSANPLSTSGEGLTPSRGNENFLWGGYSAIAPEHPHHFGAVTGEYNQPSGHASECSNDYVASWTGLGGYYKEEPFLQSGTEIGPYNEYSAWWEYYGQHEYEEYAGEFEFPVRSGDRIQDYASHRPGVGPANTLQGMASGTSPSIAGLSNGQFEIAFQANNGNLYIYNSSSGPASTGQGMAAGTSPSITALSNGQFEIAFQANNGNLYTYNSATGTTNLGLGMASHTSPSVSALPNGTFQVAFQANTGSLWTYSSNGIASNLGLGMASGTNPSIGALSNGNGPYEIAFQASTGSLWTYTPHRGAVSTSQGMASGTSPGIAKNTEVVAFQANSSSLYIYSAQYSEINELPPVITNTAQGMASGTSPSLSQLSEGGYEGAFQANTGALFLYSGETANLWVINHTTGLYGEKVVVPASAFYGGGAADFIDEKDASYLKNYNVNSWKEAKVFNNVEDRWKGLGSEENRRLSIEVPNKPGYYLSEPSSLSGGTSFNDNWKHCK
jgi:hypothetical protein